MPRCLLVPGWELWCHRSTGPAWSVLGWGAVEKSHFGEELALGSVLVPEALRFLDRGGFLLKEMLLCPCCLRSRHLRGTVPIRDLPVVRVMLLEPQP